MTLTVSPSRSVRDNWFVEILGGVDAIQSPPTSAFSTGSRAHRQSSLAIVRKQRLLGIGVFNSLCVVAKDRGHRKDVIAIDGL